MRSPKQYLLAGSLLNMSSGSSPPPISPSELLHMSDYLLFMNQFFGHILCKNNTTVISSHWTTGQTVKEMLLLRFVKGAMNIVDLLGILPYFMSLVLQLVTTEDSLVSAKLPNSNIIDAYFAEFSWFGF